MKLQFLNNKNFYLNNKKIIAPKILKIINCCKRIFLNKLNKIRKLRLITYLKKNKLENIQPKINFQLKRPRQNNSLKNSNFFYITDQN